jgi:hypothetical protein
VGGKQCSKRNQTVARSWRIPLGLLLNLPHASHGLLSAIGPPAFEKLEPLQSFGSGEWRQLLALVDLAQRN